MKTMKNKNHLKSALALALALALFAPAALAEGPRGEAGPEFSERLHERMGELRVRVLKKRAGLDDKRIEEVEAILSQGDQERRALHVSMRQAHKTLRHLIEADADDDASFEAAVSTLLKSRKRLHDLQHEELEKLRAILSPKEMGKLVMALHKLKKRMQKLKKRMHDGGMERGPRGQGRRGEGRRGRGHRGGGW